MGTIKLKFPGLSYFLLHNVLYLPKLQRILFSLVHIRMKGHSIHVFNGKVEIWNNSNNMVVMTEMEDGRLLKLNGTPAHTHTILYLYHHDSCIIPSSIFWHAINCIRAHLKTRSRYRSIY